MHRDNSGLWSDYLFTSVQNQTKAWLPLNAITEKIFYTADTEGAPINQRFVISAPLEHPIVWQVSKDESTAVFGIARITFTQDRWDPNRDYIDKDDTDDIFAMYANYYHSGVAPLEDVEDKGHCKIQCTAPAIKVGGSYRTFTVVAYDGKGKEVSCDDYTWTFTVDGEDAVAAGLVSVIADGDKRKVKFIGDRSYINKAMNVHCSCTYNGKTLEGDGTVAIVAI